MGYKPNKVWTNVAYYRMNLVSHLRVHKSYIVNIQKVRKIEGNVVYIEKTNIPVGAVYKMALDKKVKG
jgi:DNA-binding LytR/AlgR family response regulator